MNRLTVCLCVKSTIFSSVLYSPANSSSFFVSQVICCLCLSFEKNVHLQKQVSKLPQQQNTNDTNKMIGKE